MPGAKPNELSRDCVGELDERATVAGKMSQPRKKGASL